MITLAKTAIKVAWCDNIEMFSKIDYMNRMITLTLITRSGIYLVLSTLLKQTIVMKAK